MTPLRCIVNVMNMLFSLSRRFLSLTSLVVSFILFVTLWVSVSHAHDPLFLLPEQETPSQGPLLPDGTISFALYGEFLAEGETRGFQANFADGDVFQLELLIPALDPEQSLQQDQLPFLQLTIPDGSERTLYPSIRTRFDEPFTNTSYFTLIQERGTAQGGVYDVMIVSRAPARFTTAIGIKEQFGTPVQRAGERPSSFRKHQTGLANGTITLIRTPFERARTKTLSLLIPKLLRHQHQRPLMKSRKYHLRMQNHDPQPPAKMWKM